MDEEGRGAGWVTRNSNLRVALGGEDFVGDLRDDFLVGVLGHGLELFPFIVRTESFPRRLARLVVGEDEHVGEIGHAGADEGLPEEDGE